MEQAKKTCVLHLCGLTGTGKTFLLERFVQNNPGSIQILTPATIGAVFNVADADWATHGAVALDEVMMWGHESVAAGVATLEHYALSSGKKLILVTQKRDDLALAGIRLTTKPMVVQLNGRQESLDLWFDGQTLHVAKPVTA